MITSKNRPILITGSHRSGSTWVGNMLALPPHVAYIHEPFNIHQRPGICSTRFKYWYTYVCEENESLYYDGLQATLNYDYCFRQELRVAKSAKDILRLLWDNSRFAQYRLFSKRPLIKDPIALFSAGWLSRTFNMDTVVLIRHPAAFAGSLKKANWTFPFDHLLMQPLLMRDGLDKYSSEIEKYSRTEQDIIDQAILLWNLIHRFISDYKKSNPDWYFVRHEDLSRNPVHEFDKLYSRLNLDFSRGIQKKIEGFSSTKKKDSSLKRDSKSNIFQWKTRLTTDEIARIKENTYEVANEFYTEEDWVG